MQNHFDQHIYEPKNKSVLRLINDFESNYSHVFQKVRKDWLPAIREFLREETGLRMHQKVIGTKIQKDTNITFHFVTDKDQSFLKLIDEKYPNLDFEEYAAFNKLHLELKNSSKHFKEKSEKVLLPHRQLSFNLELYFSFYNINELINNLFKNPGKAADIWGAYFFNGSKIEVYYVPLILFCKINNLPLEHAIISTLVHEMAHAYHHVGKDKDNVTWSKMNFTDLKIVEGMAEYFTWLFVETFKHNHPGMEETYNRMFNCLADDYTVFKTWTANFNKEAIQSSLLAVRKKSVKDYDEFLLLLQNMQKILS